MIIMCIQLDTDQTLMITRNKKTGLVIKTTDDIRLADMLITELANENLIESKVTKK